MLPASTKVKQNLQASVQRSIGVAQVVLDSAVGGDVFDQRHVHDARGCWPPLEKLGNVLRELTQDARNDELFFGSKETPVGVGDAAETSRELAKNRVGRFAVADRGEIGGDR